VANDARTTASPITITRRHERSMGVTR
jgi:hypothetical protein